MGVRVGTVPAAIVTAWVVLAVAVAVAVVAAVVVLAVSERKQAEMVVSLSCVTGRAK
jgi:hypothetical protein